MLLVILKSKKLLKCFTQKKCKKQIKNCLELKKQYREKVIKFMFNEKARAVLLTVGLIEKTA